MTFLNNLLNQTQLFLNFKKSSYININNNETKNIDELINEINKNEFKLIIYNMNFNDKKDNVKKFFQKLYGKILDETENIYKFFIEKNKDKNVIYYTINNNALVLFINFAAKGNVGLFYKMLTTKINKQDLKEYNYFIINGFKLTLSKKNILGKKYNINDIINIYNNKHEYIKIYLAEYDG